MEPTAWDPPQNSPWRPLPLTHFWPVEQAPSETADGSELATGQPATCLVEEDSKPKKDSACLQLTEEKHALDQAFCQESATHSLVRAVQEAAADRAAWVAEQVVAQAEKLPFTTLPPKLSQ